MKLTKLFGNDDSNNQLQEFIFPGTGDKVRVLMKDGDAYFVVADIGKALGYGKAANFLQLVPEKYVHSDSVISGLGLPNRSKFIHERGVYIGVGKCRTENAQPFQEWVAEVVESIRKTGSYSVPGASDGNVAALLMPMLEELMALQEENNRRLKNIEENLEPKAQLVEHNGIYIVNDIEVLPAWDFLIRSGHRPTKEMVSSFTLTLWHSGVTATKTLPGRGLTYDRNLYSIKAMESILDYWRERSGYRPTDVTTTD